MLKELIINTLYWALIACIFMFPLALGFVVSPLWWIVYAPLAAGSLLMQLGTEITIHNTVQEQREDDDD